MELKKVKNKKKSRNRVMGEIRDLRQKNYNGRK